MYNLKTATSNKLRIIAIFGWCFMSYFVIGLFIDSSSWAAFFAVVSSALLLYICFMVPFARRVKLYDKVRVLGATVKDKPTADEFKRRRGWICGYGVIGSEGYIIAWKTKPDGIILKYYIATSRGSIKFDWKVIRQMIIFPDKDTLIELVVDDLDVRLLLPYAFEKLDVPDSVSVINQDEV